MRQLFTVRLKVELAPAQQRRGVSVDCIHCGQPATKEAVFLDGGCTILEKYCDGCIMDPPRFKEIQKAQEWAAVLFGKGK